MTLLQRLLPLLVLLLPTPAAADFAKALEGRIQDFRLANGMRFLVVENHRLPMISGLIYVNAGAAQDEPGRTGLAHLLEHLLFKGTPSLGTRDYAAERPALEAEERAFEAWARGRRENLPASRLQALARQFLSAQEEAAAWVIPNEYSQAIESAGGHNLNARTTADATYYYYALPSNRLELWFYLESERLHRPVFRQFFQEKEVIQEELRKRIANDPVGFLMESLCSTAFDQQPYREPALGRPEELDSLTPAMARDFFARYYRPDHLLAVLYGDVTVEEARRLAEKYFRRLTRQAAPARPATEPAPTGDRFRPPLPGWLSVAYRRPPLADPASLLHDAVTAWLYPNPNGLLYRKLTREKRLVSSMGSFSFMPGQRYPNLSVVYMKPGQGRSPQAALGGFQAAMAQLRRKKISFFELAEIKRRLRLRFHKSLQDDKSLGLQLATYQALTGDWRNLFRRPAAIERITAQDVEQVLQNHFAPRQQLVLGVP